MSKPLVAIVGRPNVGKSTLFNRLIGRRLAIVEDTPGVTRDRIYADAEWLNYTFTLIDTGGIEPESEDIIAKQMRRQAELAIETADVILFLTDGREGLTAADEEVAGLVRAQGAPEERQPGQEDATGDQRHPDLRWGARPAALWRRRRSA